ncbi:MULTISPECIES: PD-(D/E)XK nuclease family protein [Citrobacter]|jgi:hypothetical protein|uniref:PDDEXK-like family protein n=1 Tax=Citrobacter TaxID=544 RepID=UPI00066706BD|nr:MULTISPECIES: PD-(D/E)XK nuclease family protein [Citrobacter]QLO83680.1 PD-(D/E)XK nuclease family protein [Citrobacter sp. RHBSTW-00944]
MVSHHLLDQMTECLKEARKKHEDLNKKDAIEFNVFRYITPDENGLSRIIADLLNVHDVHGQQSLFLSSFLEMIGRGAWDATSCRFVQCEQKTDALGTKRRIDIVVQGERWTLGIENKPSAADQPNQVLDYLHELRKRRSVLNETLLIYLTPEGSRPSLISIDEHQCDAALQSGELVLLSYQSIVTWLDRLCKNDAIPYRVRVFLFDLQRFISANVLNCREGKVVDVLLDKIFNDESTLDTTLSLLSLQNNIYQTLTKKATADLIPPAGWEVCRKLYPDYGIGLRPPEAIGWHYCIEPAKGSYQDWSYGIKLDNALTTTESALLAAQQLKIDFPTGAKSSDWWPWWRSFNGYLPHDLDPTEYRDWLTSNRAWLDMNNGEFSRRCVDLFIRLHKSVSSGSNSNM